MPNSPNQPVGKNNSPPAAQNQPSTFNPASTTPITPTSINLPPSLSNITTRPLHSTCPNGIWITKHSMKDMNWPAKLILDLGKANWLEWSHTLNLAACQCSL